MLKILRHLKFITWKMIGPGLGLFLGLLGGAFGDAGDTEFCFDGGRWEIRDASATWNYQDNGASKNCMPVCTAGLPASFYFMSQKEVSTSIFPPLSPHFTRDFAQPEHEGISLCRYIIVYWR